MNYQAQLNFTKMSMREVLGAELCKVRLQAGKSMNQVARDIGCTNKAVAAAETGFRPISPTCVITIMLGIGIEPKRICELIEYAIS